MKVSRVAIFALLALISAQTVGSTLLWYAGKIKADSSSRVVTTSPATDVTTTTASLHGRFDYPDGVAQRGFQYGITTGYGSTALDSSDPSSFTLAQELTDITGGYGFTMDASGNMYRADFDGNTTASIKKYDSTGSLIAEFGSQGSGNGEFNQPFDLFLDGSGNIYVADSLNHRIQKLDSSGNYISQFSTLEQSTGSLVGPSSLAVDSLGNVYVAGGWDADLSYWGVDRQPIVQKYNAAGVLQNQLINSSGTGSNQLATSAEWQDLAVDASNNLYITDQSNTRILKYGSDASFVAQWSIGMSAGHIYAAADGQIYISDQNGYTARVYNQDGNLLREWQASNGPGYIGGIAANAQGDIWIALAGGPGVNGIVWKGKPSIDAPVDNLACDTTYHYRAFVTDADSTEYGSDATFTTHACTGLRNITTLPADSIGLTSATLHGATDYPQGITGRGFQYGLTTGYGSSVVDSGALPKFSLASQFASTFTTNLALDSGGNRYTIDAQSNKIQKFDANGTFLLEWGGNGSGNLQFDNGCGCGPSSIAIDSNDYVYVADPGNSRIQKFDANGSFVRGWSESDYDEGQFLANGGSMGISIDRQGNIYVVNTYFADSVYKYDSTGNFLAKWGDTSGLHTPGKPAFDSAGNIYIGDMGSSKIQKFDANGTFLLEWGAYGTSNGRFDGGGGLPIAVDVSDHVFVIDSGNLRIQEFNTSGDYISKVDLSNSYTHNNGSLFAKSFAISQSGELVIPFGESVATVAHSIDAPVSSLACSTTYHYRPYVTDRGGTQYGNDATFTTDACPPLNITTTTLDDGVVGVSYSDLITVDNLQGGEVYSISSGSLPPGLSINSSSGYITGTPGQSGTFNFDVTVENAGSSDTAFLTITVAEFANPLSITTSSLPDAEVDTYYQQYIYTSDSVSNVDFSVISGAIPDGMSLYGDASSGILYGTPTTPGTYNFTVQAQDSRGAGAGTDTQEYTVTVTPPGINITTTTLAPGRVGVSYNRTIEYEFASATPVFSLASGTLPPGVSLTLQGYLQGIPTQTGTFNFTVQADDGFSTDTQALSLVIVPALSDVDNSPLVTITSPGNNASFPGGASTITGTGPANQAITIFIDGAQVGATTATAQGTWSYQASGIGAGSHTLDAKWVPGAEIMFVSVVDAAALQTVIKIYDTSSDVLVKQVALPEYSYGMNVVASAAGVLVTGVDMSNNVPKVWLINLNSADVVEIPSDDLINASVFSTNGDKLYSMGVHGTFVATNMSTFETQQLGLWPENESIYSTMHLSDDGSKVYVGTTQPVVGSFNPTGLPLDQRARLGVLYELDASSGVLTNTINTVDNADLAELEYSTGLAIVGNTAYVPVVRRTATDTPGTTAESYIKLYNISTGQFIRQISVSALSAGGTVLPQGGYVDSVNNTLYFHGRSISDGVAESIVKLNLLNDVVTITPLTASESASYPAGWGVDSGGNGSKLYTPRNVVSGGVPQAYIEVMEASSGSLLATSGYPISVGTASSFAVQLGSSFSAIITPPQDSIAFSVAATPSCEAAGTCPTSCITTNSCTPQPCAVTNTCPVVPPVAQPPAPASVGTSNPKTPKIITTPFPPASPTASRLGWFDRGILAVARFVPAEAAIGFPYLLFLLLLIFALSLYYQSSNEVRKDKLNRDFITKRKSIRAQQDNFIALASHYLNTPITIIQNSIEVMGERGAGPKDK
jgi:sugar lactone lactonase YvrE